VIAAAHRVDGVFARRVVAELGRGQLGRAGDRRPGERRRAERRAGVAPVPIDAAVDIAREHLSVREEHVAEHDGLRRLQVGEAGGECGPVRGGLRDKRVLQVEQARGEAADLVAQVELQIIGGLVVARPAGAELPAQRSQSLGQHALDERVHVLVARRRGDRAGGERGRDRVEFGDDGRGFCSGQDPGALQLARVRLRRDDVVPRQAEVARVGAGELHQRRVGRRAEARSPEQGIGAARRHGGRVLNGHRRRGNDRRRDGGNGSISGLPHRVKPRRAW
jgi:hypothetical protein